MPDTTIRTAAEQTAEFLQHMALVADEINRGGLLVAANADKLSWAADQYFAAREAENNVIRRDWMEAEKNGLIRTWPEVGDPNSLVPCTQAEWAKIRHALNALGGLLREFDSQLPGGIPTAPESTEA